MSSDCKDSRQPFNDLKKQFDGLMQAAGETDHPDINAFREKIEAIKEKAASGHALGANGLSNVKRLVQEGTIVLPLVHELVDVAGKYTNALTPLIKNLFVAVAENRIGMIDTYKAAGFDADKAENLTERDLQRIENMLTYYAEAFTAILKAS